MYIDKYNITVSGDKYNDKTKKNDHDVDVVNASSNEPVKIKSLLEIIDSMMEAHEGCQIEIDVKIKQHRYE
mgnify:CR=1 FL=1